MKRVQKHLILLAAAALAVCGLTGCGKAEPDPNSGLYKAVSATMMGMTIDVDDVYENGVSFDLQDGGKCMLNLDGDEFKVKWTCDGDAIHIEGGGVELDGTIGGGDLTIANMMDSGMDMKLHCDDLLHPELAGVEPSSASTGSVLQRLRDAKSGKDVYGGSGAAASNDLWDETDEGSEAGEEGYAGSDDASGSDSDITNADYKSVTGDTFDVESMSVMVPDGWEAYEESGNSVRLMKGSTSKDDFMGKASLVIEWHPGASGTIDTSNYSEPTDIEMNFGDLVYKGQAGMIPGGWAAIMVKADHEDGYILATVTSPADDDSIGVYNEDFQAVLASVTTH